MAGIASGLCIGGLVQRVHGIPTHPTAGWGGSFSANTGTCAIIHNYAIVFTIGRGTLGFRTTTRAPDSLGTRVVVNEPFGEGSPPQFPVAMDGVSWPELA